MPFVRWISVLVVGALVAVSSGTADHPALARTTMPNTPATPSTGSACRPDPFAGGVAAQLAAKYPGKAITAHLYDARTGCEYSLNPNNRQPTASVFKVLVMAGTLLGAQQEDRDMTDWEMSQLTPMIATSANSPVRALWRSFGASPRFTEQSRLFGLDETSIGADRGGAWGGTRTSASDQVNLLRQVLLGEWGPMDEKSRTTALELMTSVVPEQTWGITAGVPDMWTVAQKHGFAGRTINSVGWVDQPGESPGYVVAILTSGWQSHASGIAALEYVNLMVAAAMIDPIPGAE